MDPLAHTLFGAALAETGLKNRTRFGAATLIVGANLPDVDVLSYIHGADAALGFRRGWTHGVLALALLPLLWTVAVVLWARWRRKTEELRPRAVLGLATLAIVSHPTLDWMNNYGVRWLMPFDGTWFYGDALFIVDPWIWWLLGTAVMLAHSHTRRSVGLWGALATLTSAAVLMGTALSPPWAPATWFVLLAVAVALRLTPGHHRWTGDRAAGPARAAVGVLVVYCASMVTLSAFARSEVARHLGDVEATGALQTITVGPLPWRPWVRSVVVWDDDEARFGQWSPGEVSLGTPTRRGADHPVLGWAREAPCIHGFVDWTRIPVWTVDPIPRGGWQVSVHDARYARRPSRDGFGTERIRLDAEGNPDCP